MYQCHTYKTKLKLDKEVGGWGFASTIELRVCFVLCLRVVKRENNEGGEGSRGTGEQEAARRGGNCFFLQIDGNAMLATR